MTRREAFALACGMNARGSTEVIVATIGLSMGALSQDLFTMIVTMAVVTTMAMPPMLRWAFRACRCAKPRKSGWNARSSKLAASSPNLERLLVAVDESPNGKFVASLAGLLAGTCRIPITVLPLAEETKHGQPDAKSPGDRVEEMVKTAAGEIKPGQRRDEDAAPVDVTVRRHDAPTEEAVTQEAKKGYDLLFVGVENSAPRTAPFMRTSAGSPRHSRGRSHRRRERRSSR